MDERHDTDTDLDLQACWKALEEIEANVFEIEVQCLARSIYRRALGRCGAEELRAALLPMVDKWIEAKEK